LQNDDKSKEPHDLLSCQVGDRYQRHWKEARVWVSSFPTSYLLEKGFLAVTSCSWSN